MSPDWSTDVADPDLCAVVAAELVDALTEALIIRPADVVARAEVICRLVDEMYASVVWLNDHEHRDHELSSLHAILLAARDHRHRMLALGAVPIADQRAAS